VRYLQLAHNEWDAATKTSRPKVLYSFGREDQLDRVVIERLVASLCRPLEPGAALAATTATGLAFVESRRRPGAQPTRRNEITRPPTQGRTNRPTTKLANPLPLVIAARSAAARSVCATPSKPPPARFARPYRRFLKIFARR
jgi:hypothetical protein